MSSVLVWFLVNPRRYPGIISGKYPSSGRVCQLAASYLFCNYPDYLIDEFWAGFLPHSRRRGVSALHTFLIFGIKGIGGKSALLWAGLGSFSSAGCLEKGFKNTHKPPLFFSFFFWCINHSLAAETPSLALVNGGWSFPCSRTCCKLGFFGKNSFPFPTASPIPSSLLCLQEGKWGKRMELNPKNQCCPRFAPWSVKRGFALDSDPKFNR